MRKIFNHPQSVPGAAPGIEHHEIAGLPGGNGQAHITCMDYSPGQVSIEAISRVDDFLSQHRPEWGLVRWIHVEGLSDLPVIQP